jgi:hypothetical protein
MSFKVTETSCWSRPCPDETVAKTRDKARTPARRKSGPVVHSLSFTCRPLSRILSSPANEPRPILLRAEARPISRPLHISHTWDRSNRTNAQNHRNKTNNIHVRHLPNNNQERNRPSIDSHTRIQHLHRSKGEPVILRKRGRCSIQPMRQGGESKFFHSFFAP